MDLNWNKHSRNLFLEDSECEISFLVNFMALDFALVSLFVDSLSWSIFHSKSELAQIDSSILADLSTISLRQAIAEPALVDICVATVSTSLILKQSAKTMEVLTVGQNLSFVDEVLLFANADELAFKSIGFMNFWTMLRVSNIVESLRLSVLLNPRILVREECQWVSPWHKFYKLIEVFTKVLDNYIVLHKSIGFLLKPCNFIREGITWRSWHQLTWWL